MSKSIIYICTTSVKDLIKIERTDAGRLIIKLRDEVDKKGSYK